MTTSPGNGGAAGEATLTCCQEEHSAVRMSPLLLRQTPEPDQAAFVRSLQQQFDAL